MVQGAYGNLGEANRPVRLGRVAKRGLPQLSLVATAEELNTAQNRLAEACIRRLLRRPPDTARPLLADRGFGRGCQRRWLWECPTAPVVQRVMRRGWDVCQGARLGMECYPAVPEPPAGSSAYPLLESGYARGWATASFAEMDRLGIYESGS